MARRVFFSFEYANDVGRAMVVRKSNALRGIDAAGFIDSADFEKIRRSGNDAIKRWIDGQLTNTSVTVVLVGRDTCSSKWVQYEIEQSKKRGNGLLGVDISKIEISRGRPLSAAGGSQPATTSTSGITTTAMRTSAAGSKQRRRLPAGDNRRRHL